VGAAPDGRAFDLSWSLASGLPGDSEPPAALIVLFPTTSESPYAAEDSRLRLLSGVAEVEPRGDRMG
jgi:hypothetical protein